MKFLIPLLLVSIIIISGCAQSNQPATSSKDLPTNKSTPQPTQAATQNPVVSQKSTITEPLTSTPPLDTSGVSSDKLSKISSTDDSQSTNYVFDFNYIDAEKITGEVTGYLTENKLIPGGYYLKDATLKWTFNSEKLIDNACEIRSVHDSGTYNLKVENSQIFLQDTGDYIVQIIVPELPVKEEIKIKTGSDCTNYKSGDQPFNFGKRPLSIVLSSTKPATDPKNIIDSFSNKQTTPSNGDFVNTITTDQNWELHFPK